jgi:uncharacterized protein (UPF0335 family)
MIIIISQPQSHLTLAREHATIVACLLNISATKYVRIIMTKNNQLEALVSRIEKLEEEKAAIAEDIKEVYSEAKNNGFDTKILKQVIAIRKKGAQKAAEEKALLASYMDALGMLADLPLGKAAIKSAGVAPSAEDDEDDFD